MTGALAWEASVHRREATHSPSTVATQTREELLEVQETWNATISVALLAEVAKGKATGISPRSRVFEQRTQPTMPTVLTIAAIGLDGWANAVDEFSHEKCDHSQPDCRSSHCRRPLVSIHHCLEYSRTLVEPYSGRSVRHALNFDALT